MSDRNPLDAFKAFVDLCSTLDIELDFKAIEKLHECLNNLAPVEPEKSCQNCRFNSGNPYLPCAVNPIGFGELNCAGWEEQEEGQQETVNASHSRSGLGVATIVRLPLSREYRLSEARLPDRPWADANSAPPGWKNIP
ncbi:MAG: hypothetical protein EBS38_08505 [Actinobacteria bacterium]|nr:hypothetical protein [Actinomycetota bacterium]